ncbi:hypothetical protein [Trichormus sp. NMC-1]|uniref:hypothetical protein n=1 Tax=Trichormus sp. NMC-1 TaxID=1853259 RepID=UPI0015A68325|nr:hypothetical protein [Trichormus sp. NMC-1]
MSSITPDTVPSLIDLHPPHPPQPRHPRHPHPPQPRHPRHPRHPIHPMHPTHPPHPPQLANHLWVVSESNTPDIDNFSKAAISSSDNRSCSSLSA